jgi:hypothetical protein
MQKPKTQILTVLTVAAALVLAIATLRALLRQWPEPRRHPEPCDVLWVKCRDPNCAAQYLVSLAEYYTYLNDHADATSLVPPPLVCVHCGLNSIYRAFKCAKCDVVSFRRSVPDDFADRCPNCGYSQIEVDRDKAAELRRRYETGQR